MANFKKILILGLIISQSIALAQDVPEEKQSRESKLSNATNLQQQIDDLEESIAELQERADENELQAALSKIKFGLEFNTMVSNFFIKNPLGLGIPESQKTQPNRWAMGLYLNMNADINDYTKFTGRLSMSKAFGDLSIQGNGNPSPLDAGRGFYGPNIYVERAYIDIYGGDHFAFTIGRLPSTDGPGSNLRNGGARMATYPALMVNALGDGAVFTFKNTEGDIALRAGYSKIYQPLSDSNGVSNIFGTRDAIDSNLFFAIFETPFLPKSAGESLFMLGYAAILKYTLPEGSFTLPTSNSVSNNNSNIGDLHYIGAHFEHRFNFGLNWFLSGVYYRGLNPKNMVLNNGTPMAIFNDKGAYAIHLGLRQDIGNHFKIGVEYFNSSKNWYALSRASVNDPLNFRNTKGDVIDVYAIFQIDLYQFFRLAFTQQNNKYANYAAPIAPTGSATAINTKIQNVSLSYILRF
ncbi:hypothetical protein CCY99_03645 [Helicobacter sp. 16-1353]|uniref:DUF3373 family protein n=1 Tax=Helicobacter sp. 16-1353 TaxID=2004996 RepID=UPI000DCF22F4|nr:DUF3373 family protein [Helicobacter sp. 16-1353]RAX54453.1 hypothetical protein CCY99_03645 [Helicobacter sp. 16-1353]